MLFNDQLQTISPKVLLEVLQYRFKRNKVVDEDIHNYLKERAEAEAEYGRSLQKLGKKVVQERDKEKDKDILGNVRKSAFLYMGNSLETAQCHLLLSNKLLSDFDQVITARDKELVSKWAEVKKLESSASKQAKPFESKQKKFKKDHRPDTPEKLAEIQEVQKNIVECYKPLFEKYEEIERQNIHYAKIALGKSLQGQIDNTKLLLMNLEKAKGSVDALDAEKEIELLASFMTKLKATYGDKSVDSVPDNGDNSPRSLSQPARQQSNLNPAISAPITAPDINTSANVDEEGFSIPQMDASTWKNQITSETEDDDSDEDSSSRKATTKFKIAISEKSTAEASHSVDNSNQLLSIMKVLKPQSDISLEEPAKENSINAVETIKAPFVFQTESQEQSDNGINNPVSPAIWQDTFSSHPSPISDNSSVKKTESPDVMWDASFNSEPAVWKPSAQAEAKSIFSESPRQSFSGNAAIESTGLDSTFNTPAATASNLHITTSKEFPAPTPDPKEIPKNTFDNSSFSPTTPDVFTSPAAEISSVFGNSGTGPFVTVSSQNEKVNKAPSVEEIAASAFSGPPPALAEIPQSDSTKKSLPDLQKEQRTYELKAATQISNPALKVNVPSANENAAFVKSNEIAAKVETTPSAVPKSVKPEILTRKPKKAPPPPIPTEISPISNSQSKSIGPIPEQNSNTVQAAVKSETPVATSESSPENSTKPSSASDASKSVKNEQTVNQSLHEIAKTQTQFQPANIQASSESIDESPTPVPLARNRKSMISKSSKVEPLSAQGSVQSLLSNDSNRPLNAAQESSGIVQRNRARNLLETAIQNKLMAVASMQQSEIHAAENQEAQPSDAVDSSQKSSVQENSAFISSKPAEKTLPIPPKPPALPPSSPPPDAISRIPPKPPLPSALPPPNQLPKPPLPSNLPPLKPPILPTMPLKMPQPPPLSPPPIGLPPPGATVMPPPNAPQTPKRKSKPPTPAGLEASIKAKALSEPETSQNPPLDTK